MTPGRRVEAGPDRAGPTALPALASGLAGPDHSVAPGNSGSLTESGATATILLVDDSRRVREVLRDILKRAGFSVVEAATGTDALRLATERPDLIILDVHLPDLDGFEVCRRIKADPHGRTIPVLHLSGVYREAPDRARGLGGGADAYLTQPVDAGELVATVRTLLRLRRTEAELRASEARRQAAEALAEGGRLLTQSLHLGVVTQRMVDSIRALFEAPSAALFRLDAESGDLPAVAISGDIGPTGGRPVVLPAGVGAVGLAVRAGEPIMSPDVLTDPRLTLTLEVRARVERAPFRAVLAVPLAAHGRVSGALALGDRLGRQFSEEEIQLAQAFADQAALALENARLFEEAERRRRQAESLAEVSSLLAQSLNPEEVAQRMADHVRALFGARTFILYRVEPTSGDLAVMAHSGDWGPAFDRHVVIPRGVAVAGLALVRREPVVSADLLEDRNIRLTPDIRARIERAPYRAVLAVPLLIHGRVIGVLAVGDRRGRVFTPDEVRFAETLADRAAVALENSRLYAEVRGTRDSLQAIAENSPDAIVTTDIQGRVTYVSPGAEEMFGHTAEKIVGSPAADYYPGGTEEARALMRRLRAEGRIRNYETAIRTKDNRWVAVSASFSLLRDASGTVLGTLGAMKDVSERKRAEAALAESQHLLRTIIETEPECVKLVAADGTLLDMNRAGLAMIEAESLEQVAGKPVEPLVAPEYRPAFRTLAEAVFRGESGELEFEIVGLKGTRRWLETHAVPLRTQKGDIMALLAVTREITQRKRAEAALRESEAQLRQAQKMEAIGRLAGGISHDFNNLLTVITGRTELLLEQLGPAEPARRIVALIGDAAARAAGLSRQLLVLSRKQVLQPRVVDLSDVVAGVEPILRRLIGEDVTVCIVAASHSCRVEADPGQLEQVVLNLAVNARDAMPQGGRLTIETASVDLAGESAPRPTAGLPPGGYVRLTVRDTGVGMDEETKAHVFEPFFTTKEPGQGTGLGLATVYGIVTQSGGRIEVESAPGCGSTFRIDLPRVHAAVEVIDPAVPSGGSGRGTETVLLVEDAGAVRETARESLERYGYTVLEARHPGEALLVAERYAGPIHVLVTDLVMPQMSGREVADRLTALRPAMRVLYMSGYTDDAIVHRGAVTDGTPFLQKPFTPATLARAVRDVLDRGRAGAEPDTKPGGGPNPIDVARDVPQYSKSAAEAHQDATEEPLPLGGRSRPPWVAIVQEGRSDVFEALRATLEAAGIAEVVWDRRRGERRTVARRIGTERRQAERRAWPPSSWATLGFLMVPRTTVTRDSRTGRRLGGRSSARGQRPARGG